MRNQLLMAERAGVRAATIDSDNRAEWDEVEGRVRRGEVDLLLVSPERLNNARFRADVLPSLTRTVGLLVVDEAHCISDWGHDFRPDYRRIRRIVDLLPAGVPVLCTTATANDRVVGDIVAQLGDDLIVERGPLDRESLSLGQLVSRRSDTELAALLLTQRLVDAGAPPLKAGEFWSIVRTVGDLGILFGQDPAGIADLDIAAGRRIATLLDAATSFAFALDDAEQTGLRLLTGTSENYPGALTERLGSAAPPILYVLGDPDLLAVPAVGVVGSRSVSGVGAEVAGGASVAAVRHGLGVISGGAEGVDRLAMSAALDTGGRVVGMLAESLLRTSRDPEVRRAIADESLCLCSPYKPTAGFSVANAMGRNKLIYALSVATLVAECEKDKGGTWSGAVEALRQQTAPVLDWTGEGAPDGNRALVERGAKPGDDLNRLFPLPPLVASAERSTRQLALGL